MNEYVYSQTTTVQCTTSVQQIGQRQTESTNRKALLMKIPADTHSYHLLLLMDMLTFTDDIHKRSASFVTACLKSDSTLVRLVAEFGILVGRCDSILG